MPNGRSGGFSLERSHLRRLLTTLASDAVLGAVLGAHSRWVPGTTAEILQLADHDGHDPVPVEEQDGVSYIIHLRDSPDSVWVGVRADSPLFGELRNRHQHWMREHPNYRDWFGF